MKLAQKAYRGFTLVEMAIVLLILAVLLGGGLTVLSAQIEQQQIKDTQRLLEDTREALIGFAVVNGRLPRPANSATDGTERAVCTTDANCTGFIPWTILGLNKVDAWGKIIRYSVSPAFADTPIQLATTGTKIIQSRLDNGTPVTMGTNIPVLVFSHGKNNFGTSASGTAMANGSGGATNADEIANNTGPITFHSRSMNGNTAFNGGEFDDLVVWLSPHILFNRLIQAGRL